MRLSFPMFRANRHILTLICALGFALSGTAQQLDVPKMDYGYPKEYTIGGLTVSGCVTRDPNAVKLFSGLKVGDKITIPGEQIGKAIPRPDAIAAVTAAALYKDMGTEIEQQIPADIADAVAARLEMGADPELLQTLAYLMQLNHVFSLRGGTREILRGMIARGLGLR